MASPKSIIRQSVISLVNSLGTSSELIGTPGGLIDTEEWCRNNGATYRVVWPGHQLTNKPPVVLEECCHQLYKNELEVQYPDSFLAVINNGRVWGRNGAVITPDDLLLNDVSREFGKYGGVFGREHSVFRQIKLSRARYIDGTVAVIASPGAYNFHHWLYDNIARFGILEQCGFLKQADYFVLDYMGIPFQTEALKCLNIPEEKILNCHDNWHFHIKARKLIVPSLPSRLGVVTPWVVAYLKKLFAPDIKPEKGNRRIYISRKKADTRRLKNEDDLLDFLQKYGFEPYFAEDHSIAETAQVFSESSFVVGVHGSGLSNLAFSPEGVKVIDIIEPKHLDPYYWIITNIKKGDYAYFVSEGDFDLNKTELVENKVNNDLVIDLDRFKRLFSNILATEH
ncbi:MAG: glycosyltransferase family 61 protein [Chitinophagales bacterium]|nr:glycosyltransferase family 61 protein [Chitinophagales bacterium]